LDHTVGEPSELEVVTPAQARKARGLLISTVDDTYLAYISQCADAYGAWEALRAAFQSKTQNRQLQLRQDLGNCKQERESISVYYARVKSIWTKLLATGYQVDEQEVVWSFLSGLSIQFATLTLVLKSSDKELRFVEVLGKLVDYESTVERVESDSFEVKALKAQARGLVCFFCNKPGHFKKECEKYLEWKEKKEKATAWGWNPTKNISL
jgi:hypothetical protein